MYGQSPLNLLFDSMYNTIYSPSCPKWERKRKNKQKNTAVRAYPWVSRKVIWCAETSTCEDDIATFSPTVLSLWSFYHQYKRRALEALFPSFLARSTSGHSLFLASLCFASGLRRSWFSFLWGRRRFWHPSRSDLGRCVKETARWLRRLISALPQREDPIYGRRQACRGAGLLSQEKLCW